MNRKWSAVIVFIFCAVIFLPASQALALEPVYNVADHPIPTIAAKLSVDDVRKHIMLAGLKRHWVFEEVGPGELKATQRDARRLAIIKVTYTATTYSIELIESSGMDQRGDQIHRNYNRWIRYLLQDIDDELSRAAITGATNDVGPPISVPASKPQLGVRGGTVTRNQSGPSIYLPDPYGAWIDDVVAGGAGAKAGLRRADIIRTFNGHRVETFEELEAFAAEAAPGTRVRLGVFRNREMITIDVDL